MSNNTEKPAYLAVKTWHDGKPVYVAEQPAQLNQRSVKPWVVLTDEEIYKMTVLMGINPDWKPEMEVVRSVVRNLEAKLKEKNT